jgi:hypothetical protein
LFFDEEEKRKKQKQKQKYNSIVDSKIVLSFSVVLLFSSFSLYFIHWFSILKFYELKKKKALKEKIKKTKMQ